MTFDPTKPVQTRCGYPARILATDLKNPNHPIVAAVTKDSGTEMVESYKQCGTLWNSGLDEMDLINIPQKHVRWVNVFGSGDGFYVCSFFESEAAARIAIPHPKLVAKAIRIEFTEGEGL